MGGHMTTTDVVSFAIDRASAINVYWNIYIAVATAVVGVLSTGKLVTRSRILKALLTVLFLIFAISNLLAIIRLGELRQALVDMIPSSSMDFLTLKTSLAPEPWWAYLLFQGTLDLLLVLAIWFVPWPGSRGGEAERS